MSKKKLNVIKIIVLLLLITVNAIVFSYLGFLALYEGRFFPKISIAGTKVDRQTPEEINTRLSINLQTRLQSPLILELPVKNQEQTTFKIDLAAAKPQLNLDNSLKEAYFIGRSGNTWKDLNDQIQLLISGQNLTPKLTYQKPSALIFQINQLNQKIKKEALDAQVVFGNQITIIPSSEGLELDDQELIKEIESYLALTGIKPQLVPTKKLYPKFATNNAEAAKQALDLVKDKPMKIHYQEKAWTIDQAALFSLLDLGGTTSAFNIPASENIATISALIGRNLLPEKRLLINKNKLGEFLKQVADEIDRPAQDAKFTFDASLHRVKEFKPAQEGRKIDLEKTATVLIQALNNQSEVDIELPVQTTQPKIMTSDINNFGIKELIGQGISNFTGSIDNRIYNIGLAAFRVNGTLIPPGETFSFNAAVGDISGPSGYKQAYVIKEGRTVLDDGGGVCQVSTTLFRAVLNAGLPIVARTAHAYRVGYYEQGFPPGLDATVFSPSVDFRFKNDTNNHILVQAYIKGSSLYFDLYGTPDGRVSTLTTPKISSQTPPPPELRQDDPTLPKGTVKQVDWPAWGANVSFNRTVTRNGETLISETWKSNYKPWQAVYLVGTKE